MKTIMAFLVVGMGVGAAAVQADDDFSAFRVIGAAVADGRGELRTVPIRWDDDDDDGGRHGWYVVGDDHDRRWDDDDDDGRWNDDDDDRGDDDDRWDDDDD